MTYVQHELTEDEHYYLFTQGYDSILDYGWERVFGQERRGEYEYDDWYKGSILRDIDGKHYIICKVDDDYGRKMKL